MYTQQLVYIKGKHTTGTHITLILKCVVITMSTQYNVLQPPQSDHHHKFAQRTVDIYSGTICFQFVNCNASFQSVNVTRDDSCLRRIIVATFVLKFRSVTAVRWLSELKFAHDNTLLHDQEQKWKSCSYKVLQEGMRTRFDGKWSYDEGHWELNNCEQSYRPSTQATGHIYPTNNCLTEETWWWIYVPRNGLSDVFVIRKDHVESSILNWGCNSRWCIQFSYTVHAFEQ